MLLFNIKTRLSSLFLGLIIIFTLLASKPLFRNHIFIVGSVLFLVGISNNKTVLKLLILQLSIVYLGASVNKIFEIDWWSGQFMENWLSAAENNPVYIYISALLPSLVFAKILFMVCNYYRIYYWNLTISKKMETIGSLVDYNFSLRNVYYGS